MHVDISSDHSPVVSPTITPVSPPHRLRWQAVLSLIVSLVVVVAVWRNRAWLHAALALAFTAQPWLVGGALTTILLSYLASSQVFRIGLRRFGQRIDPLQLWAMTITGITISQSLPAGAVGSYAFFMRAFQRRGVTRGQAGVLAGLEALSYAGAMLLIGTWSMVDLAIQLWAGTGISAVWEPLAAVVVAAALLSGSAWLVTRSEATLTAATVWGSHALRRLVRRPRNDDWGGGLVKEVVHGRSQFMAQPRAVLLMVLMQLLALCGHSFALLLVLRSLHVNVSFAVALAAFGIAIITSTFNVLPGGGGTVEGALVAILLKFGGGTAAASAAILFRLLNFWVMLPVAGALSAWLERRGSDGRVPAEHRAV